jgi:uncharacterized protein Usg
MRQEAENVTDKKLSPPIGAHPRAADPDFALQLRDYRLTLAEILYHLPDHPALLQSYVWQQLDIAPKFPELHRFLNFWEREIEGKIHSVKVDHCTLIRPTTWLQQHGAFVIH